MSNTLPQSPEAEFSVLGAALLDDQVLNEVIHKLTEDHFMNRSHKILFKTLCQMASKSLPIDSGTVFTFAEGQGSADQIGGAHYLSKICTSFPSQAHVAFYIKELCDKLRLRKLLEMGADICSKAYTVPDAGEYLQEVENRFYGLAEQRQDDNLVQSSYRELMIDLQGIKDGVGIGATPTGLSAIDDTLMGICPGMMDVYAAEAGCGKTSMAEMMILAYLLMGKVPCIFQRDMTPKGFYLRLACRMAKVSVSQIRKFGHKMPDKVDEVMKIAKKLSETPLKIFSPDGCTGADIRSIVKREKRKSGIELVIVDHIRTLRHTKKTGWEGLEENSSYIRQSTNESGVPHVVLAHINREGSKSDRPSISDIKGGDQLKDDADNVCIMWAPDGKPQDGETKEWKVNFAFDKTRWDINCLKTMNFHGPTMTFKDIPDPNLVDKRGGI